MRREQSSFSSATRTWWYGLSERVRTTIACTASIVLCTAVAIGATVWDATDDSLGPEHPLSLARLALRLVTFLATGVAIAIGTIVAYRTGREATRLRRGLCVKCGYDLRAQSGGDRCPECGSPVPARPAA